MSVPGAGHARLPVIAITSGEPAGIGPDLCLAMSRAGIEARLVVVGDLPMLEARRRQLGLDAKLVPFDAMRGARPGEIEVEPVPALHACVPGTLDSANARYVLAVLDRAIDGCQSGEFSAMVTAPVHKGVINEAGVPFTGHTEYLAQRAAGAHVVMMLTGGGLRVALATTHLALSDVPGAITRDSLERTLRVVEHDLRERFGIEQPRILVSGLNPHSGESGHLGREEIEVISPLLESLRAQGMRLEGPIPADTLFVPSRLEGADCVLAMYHDQGLPVLKYASFGEGVNVTLGLPFVRTSVDHGTALDLAGSGRAESGSLRQATLLAVELARRAP